VIKREEAGEKSAKARAFAGASYSLDVIRLKSRDATTGAVSCAADLHAVLPEGTGSAKEPITYEVEQTSDGKLYVTVRGLR